MTNRSNLFRPSTSMASLGELIEEQGNEDENVDNDHINIPDILSDIEEDMTFSQIINKYNDDSMFNSSIFNDSINPDTQSLKSSNDDETDCTPTRLENDISEVTNNMDPKNTQNLRCFLEKECFPETQWSNDLIFNASTDKVTYQDMDITQYVGQSRFKDKEGSGSFRIYFNPKDYSVQQELETIANLPDDISVKDRVQTKFKSEAYLKLCRDLREASGKCGFHIVQNGNQKIDLKRTGLKIRNRICCLRYCVYKGNKKISLEIMNSEDTHFTMTERTKDPKGERSVGGVIPPNLLVEIADVNSFSM